MLTKKELEELRPWVNNQVAALLGFPESAVVNTALDCIGKSLNRQATTEHLFSFLESAAPSFVESLYKKVLEIKSAKLASGGSSLSGLGHKKRNIEDVFGEGADDANSEPEVKKSKRATRFEAENGGADGGGGNEDTSNGNMQSQIEAMLATTRKQIEERRKQTQALLQTPPIAPIMATPSLLPLPAHQQVAVSEAIDKARKAAELKARIQAQLQSRLSTMSNLTGSLGTAAQPLPPAKPTPLILDAEGRTVDSSGRAIQLSMRQPTLKANIRAQQRQSFKQITSEKPKEEQTAQSVYFDPRVTSLGNQRSKKAFTFNEPGKYVRLGQTLRAKAQLEKLQDEIMSAARKTGISSATKLALIAPGMELREDDIPPVEWWDADILPNRSYTDFDRQVDVKLKYKSITALVEHPISFLPPGEPRVAPFMPVILTKQRREERKEESERREERKEERVRGEREREERKEGSERREGKRREEKRENERSCASKEGVKWRKRNKEKIRFGLIDKPEPKVRISNLMRVLGTEAIQDPTKVEAHVRAQMAERQRKHEEANAARKLTPAESRAKKLKKVKEDVSCGVHVTVYRVRDLSNPKTKFKVDMNAQQYHLTGCVLLYKDVNLVILEGGPKALRKFKRLMLNRIKWNPDNKKEDSDSETERQKKRNCCDVVWEGMNQTRCFYDWKMKHCPTESLAREHLKKFGVEHYWDLALSKVIVEQEGEED
eukprot:Em0010g905a